MWLNGLQGNGEIQAQQPLRDQQDFGEGLKGAWSSLRGAKGSPEVALVLYRKGPVEKLSPSSELLFTPTPPPLPFTRLALSPELQAITSEWISLTLGVSRSSTPAVTPPLPPLPDTSVCHFGPSSPSFGPHQSSFSSSPSSRGVISPLPSCPSRPQSSAQNLSLSPLQGEEKSVSSPSPHVSHSGSPCSAVGSPDSFLSELSDVLGQRDKAHRSRVATQSAVGEDGVAADTDCRGAPDFSRETVCNEIINIAEKSVHYCSAISQPLASGLKRPFNDHKSSLIISQQPQALPLGASPDRSHTPQDVLSYQALYSYVPQNDDELELRDGDLVDVMEKCDDGWFVGTSRRTRQFGTFPGNYVKLVSL
ncbi:UNVERIFIED_CONTAM: hypothetical protein K2H54_005410 [Gekko kuhli]